MNLPDKEYFDYKDCVISGDDCWLIVPNSMSTPWDDSNARFRSCIVRKSDNFVVSQGWKKFTNLGERPEFEPWDNNWKFQARHKLDGSLLIVSAYKGEWILRTRGTTDARLLPNGKEVSFLLDKYEDFFKKENKSFTEAVGLSYLFEWTTPTNIIVLRESDEPKLTLLGIVLNSDATYYSQSYVDAVAKEFNIDRPHRYEYNSVKECLTDVRAWVDKEGVVLFSPDNQTLKKIKADHYLELHKMATGMGSLNNLLEIFLTAPERYTEVDNFFSYMETLFDYEIALKCKDNLEKICNAYTWYLNTLSHIRSKVDVYVSGHDSRKIQAEEINNLFHGWMNSYAFSYLDGKDLSDNKVKEILKNLIGNEDSKGL